MDYDFYYLPRKIMTYSGLITMLIYLADLFANIYIAIVIYMACILSLHFYIHKELLKFIIMSSIPILIIAVAVSFDDPDITIPLGVASAMFWLIMWIIIYAKIYNRKNSN